MVSLNLGKSNYLDTSSAAILVVIVKECFSTSAGLWLGLDFFLQGCVLYAVTFFVGSRLCHVRALLLLLVSLMCTSENCRPCYVIIVHHVLIILLFYHSIFMSI